MHMSDASPQPPILNRTPETHPDHLLPEHTQTQKKGGGGAIVGIVIIVLLMIFGGLYFWGAALNRDSSPLPLIPGDTVNS
jgi:hypothetical protein